MTECLHQGRLSDHLDGSLPEEQRELLDRHLEESPPCGCPEELQRLRELVEDLSALQPGPMPAGGWERLDTALQDPARGPGLPPDRRWLWIAAAAVLTLLVGGNLLLRFLQPSDEPAVAVVEELLPEMIPAADPVAVPRPEWMTVRAPVGRSPVLLAAAADAELPKLEIPDDLLQRYSVEIGAVDRLLTALGELPETERRRDDVQRQVAELRSLKSDLYTELVLQAQARRTGVW